MGSANGAALTEQESLRRKVCEEVKRRHDLAGLASVHISVFFNEQKPLSKRTVEPTAAALATLVGRSVPAVGSRFEKHYDWVNRSYFPEEVNTLAVWNIPGVSATSWSAPQAAFLQSLSSEEMQTYIGRKEAKVPIYRKRCKACLVAGVFARRGAFISR
jgi:hypothetical protein